MAERADTLHNADYEKKVHLEYDKKFNEFISEYEAKINKLLKETQNYLDGKGMGNGLFHTADVARKAILNSAKHSTEAIKNNPFKSVLISCGVSLLAGYIFGKIY